MQSLHSSGIGLVIAVYEFINDSIILTNETYKTTYEYDDNDNLIRIIDELGNVFQFGYDSLSRKVSMSDPDLGVWLYKYDQNGN